jgi:hypothetical protein
VSYGISVDFVVEVEEDAKADVCKDGMCGFGENVIYSMKEILQLSRVAPMSNTP